MKTSPIVQCTKPNTIKTILFEQGQEHKIRWNRKNNSPDFRFWLFGYNLASLDAKSTITSSEPPPIAEIRASRYIRSTIEPGPVLRQLAPPII